MLLVYGKSDILDAYIGVSRAFILSKYLHKCLGSGCLSAIYLLLEFLSSQENLFHIFSLFLGYSTIQCSHSTRGQRANRALRSPFYLFPPLFCTWAISSAILLRKAQDRWLKQLGHFCAASAAERLEQKPGVLSWLPNCDQGILYQEDTHNFR